VSQSRHRADATVAHPVIPNGCAVTRSLIVVSWSSSDGVNRVEGRAVVLGEWPRLARHWVAAVRIDQPDEDGSRADDADTPDANEARDAFAAGGSGEADRSRAVPGASAGEREAYRVRADAVFREYAIDQAYDRVREIERDTVTPAMKRIEAEDPER